VRQQIGDDVVDFIQAFCCSSTNAAVKEYLEVVHVCEVVVKIKKLPTIIWTTLYIMRSPHTRQLAIWFYTNLLYLQNVA